MSVTIADIEAARRTIAGAVLRTPMLPAPKLSALTGKMQSADLLAKLEASVRKRRAESGPAPSKGSSSATRAPAKKTPAKKAAAKK